MIAPEPLQFAIAHHALNDVQSKLRVWKDELSAKISVIVTEFARWVSEMPQLPGADFHDVAEAQADVLIDAWCKERQRLADEITGALHPDTIVVLQRVGMAGQLGDVIGLHLDSALRDLDGELRSTIKEAF